MTYTVVIPQDITDAGKNYLTERGYNFIIGSGNTDPKVMANEVAEADAILARTAPYPAAVLSSAPRLKVIGRHGIGVDNIDLTYCKEHNIAVTYAPNSNAISVAEHTIGALIAAAHHFSRFDRGVRKGEWNLRNTYKSYDLGGKTLGLVGIGRIGSQVGLKCIAAFGMRVIGYDPYLPMEKFPGGVVRIETLNELFEESDFISLHMPSTPETRRIIDINLLRKMKKESFIVNCARGEILNLDDLYNVLKDGGIAGAALDVFEQEPPDILHPIFSLENVILTPHSAALTQESMDRMGLHAAMGIHAVLSGGKPEWPVKL